MTTNKEGGNAYATLVTRPSYLAGAILLAYSLHKHSPDTPLIIMYTPSSIPDHCVRGLKADSLYSNSIIRPVRHLRLPDGNDSSEHGMVAERFVDTWTKLRVFELHDTPFSTICFLDADMLIFKDPSPIVFSAEAQQYLQLEQGRGVLATHVCVCNLDKDPWAPASWTKENCAYTALDESSPPPAVQENPETHSIFNSGAVVFRPSKPLSDFIFASFHDTDLGTLRKMKFPDQDFLNSAFRGRWRSLPWSVNGLKTWRYWHTNIWSDEGVRVLHYIVDKPWARTIGEDGKAGYRGDDGETHRWWWAEYERWREERQNQGEHRLLQTTKELVADGADEKAEMSAIGSRVQAWAQSKA